MRSPVWWAVFGGLAGFAIGWRLFEIVSGWFIVLAFPLGLILGVFAIGVPIAAHAHRKATGSPLPPEWWKPAMRELWWWKR